MLVGCDDPQPTPREEPPNLGGGLDARELLIRASIDVRGIRPTAEELARLDADTDVLPEILDELSYHPGFGKRIATIYAEALRMRRPGFAFQPEAGTLETSAVDWATFLAQSSRDTYLLPHANASARVFPGAYGSLVGSVQGRFRDVLDGTLAAKADVPARAPLGPAAERVDQHLIARLEASAAGGDDMAAIYLDAMARSRTLATAGAALAIEPAEDRRDRIDNALDLLASGLTRCASVGGPQFEWDSHKGSNSSRFDELFKDLHRLFDRLDTEVASDGTLLADKVVVVVTSEMGRTPLVNTFEGRDHWPFTSAMIIGRGVTGGRTIGGFSESYLGVGVDPTTGELAPDRPGISCESFGATLLLLGDVDPEALLPGVEPITAVLA